MTRARLAGLLLVVPALLGAQQPYPLGGAPAGGIVFVETLRSRDAADPARAMQQIDRVARYEMRVMHDTVDVTQQVTQVSSAIYDLVIAGAPGTMPALHYRLRLSASGTAEVLSRPEARPKSSWDVPPPAGEIGNFFPEIPPRLQPGDSTRAGARVGAPPRWYWRLPDSSGRARYRWIENGATGVSSDRIAADGTIQGKTEMREVSDSGRMVIDPARGLLRWEERLVVESSVTSSERAAPVRTRLEQVRWVIRQGDR